MNKDGLQLAQTFMTWLNGYLCVTLKGNSPERFLNLCRTRNVPVRKINCEGKKYDFCIGIQQYKELKPIVRKTKTRPMITKKCGFPFFANHWKKRAGFLFGILFFFGLLVFMSRLLWCIEIEGQYTHTKEELIKFMKSEEIRRLIFLKDINGTKLEESIRKQYNDIGWVSAQIDGTKLIVRIKETNMPSLYDKQTIPVHMIANRDGTVYSIVTRSGTPMVKALDEVKAGDILISGVVNIVGDNQEIVRKNPQVADGDIFIRTEYEYLDERSLKYIGKDYTNKCVKEFHVRFANNYLNFFVPDLFIKNWKNTSKTVETSQYLFASVDKVTKREYLEVEKMYSLKEAEDYLNKRFQKYVQEIIKKGVIIETNNVKIKRMGDKVKAIGTLGVLEPVTTYRKILDSEWRSTESDEHSGDDN